MYAERRTAARKDILDTHTHTHTFLYTYCMEAKFANGEGALAVVLIDLIYL